VLVFAAIFWREDYRLGRNAVTHDCRSNTLLRNDHVYSFQTNRNPFVDRPGWVAAAFAPALSIARASNAIALTWTNEAPAMSAEQSTGLAAAWTAVTNAPALTASNTWMIVLPVEHGTRLFRLRVQ
jgi:hypothetical protein